MPTSNDNEDGPKVLISRKGKGDRPKPLPNGDQQSFEKGDDSKENREKPGAKFQRKQFNKEKFNDENATEGRSYQNGDRKFDRGD
eukprot:CAMPEP_0114579958 /NCGR_PEP_ID=MMETSP0125-20121206/4291_1 /TAXON_ID=485358 ORGANISM="Aristerostoma sp., Strain ATCC 50986" /NCGR_SAMPLE_ID=MMETSP0125 /ASSEMBLY_ACC=CAM_ASM_000245 /LENGTH=84 /DNA_ID=CAMNT_0001771135 /DNA_START=1 /DNA_END=252 /DNA_ORIENTATION=+